LTSAEAKKRLAAQGPNSLPERKAESPLFLFASQFQNPFVYILFAAAAISFFLGHSTDAIFIMIVIAINAAVGFFQEYKAEQSLKLVKKSLTSTSRVFRDGREEEIDARLLVPGDVVAVSASDRVTADGRILESENLEANESSFTGESLPVEKSAAMVPEEADTADRTNMLHAGTLIESGRAKILVAATGPRTEIGAIASLLTDEKEPATPLQKTFARFASVL
jgi:Ca2+-transporting ATPase